LKAQGFQPTRKELVMDKDRIVGAAKDVAGNVEKNIGNLAGDTRTQASGATRQAEGVIQNAFGQAKDVVRDVNEGVATFAKDAVSATGTAYEEASRAVGDQVQKAPIGSLLVAGAVGFALALMLNRQPPRPRPYYRW
jgi:uncharacterized protein YjbJ (UPF0337 family)